MIINSTKWPLKTLASVTTITMGQSPPGESYNTDANGLPFFQGKAEFGEKFPTVGKWCTAPTRIAEEDDILMSVRAPVGPVNIAPCKCCIGRGLASIRPDKTKVDCGYLWHFFGYLQPQLSNKGEGSTFAAINRNDVEQIQIPLPPLPEQKRIAALLDKADAIRRKRAEALQLTDTFLQSVFIDMFGDPVTNPKGWPTLTLGELAPDRGLIVDGPFGSSLKPECYVSDGVRVIRNYNIHDDHFDDSSFKFVTQDKFDEISRSEVISNDVLLSTKGTIGNVCLMPEFEGPSVLSASGTVRIRIPEGAPVTPLFVVSQMAQPAYKSHIHSFQAGSNQKYLNLSGIRHLRLICPPLALQEEYLLIRKRSLSIRSKTNTCQDSIDALFHSLGDNIFQVTF